MLGEANSRARASLGFCSQRYGGATFVSTESHASEGQELGGFINSEGSYRRSISALLLLSFFGLSSFSGGLLGGSLGILTLVESEGTMLVTNRSDEALFSQISEESSGDGASDLELLAKHGSGDAEDLGDLFHHPLVLLLFEEHSIVKLFLDLNLGP